MKKDDELFLAQYNQVWEQRRQHVTLIWTIPTVGGAVIAFALSQIPIKELNIFSVHILFALLSLFSYSVFKIFLRHNTFQQAYGFLLTHLDNEKKPLAQVPQTGEDLFKWCRDKRMKFDFWLQKGSEYKGIDSWVMGMLSLAASLIILWLDFTNLPTSIVPIIFSCLPNEKTRKPGNSC